MDVIEFSEGFILGVLVPLHGLQGYELNILDIGETFGTLPNRGDQLSFRSLRLGYPLLQFVGDLIVVEFTGANTRHLICVCVFRYPLLSIW